MKNPREEAITLDEAKKEKAKESTKEKKVPVRTTRTISGNFICKTIRMRCLAAKASGRERAEVGLSTIYWSLDKWHYLEYSFRDHKAVIAKYWDVKYFEENEDYDIEELYAFMDEYIFEKDL